MDPAERVLRSKAASPLAITTLFARWVFFAKQGGGLENERERSAAESILSRLLASLHASGEFDIPVIIDGDIQRRFGVFITGSNVHYIRIRRNGMVDMRPFMTASSGTNRGRFLSDYFNNRFNDAEEVPLLQQLFRTCLTYIAEMRGRQPLALQIIWRVADRLEKLVIRALDEDIEIGMVQVEPSLEYCTQSQICAMYYQTTAGLQHTESMPFISVAPDKAHVDIFNMFSAAYALPGNLGFWGVPLDLPHLGLSLVPEGAKSH